MNSTVYVTTSIPYVNSRPHIGFALELVQADVIARYRRLVGHEVRFQTGTDENAQKNVIAARERGLTTQELVDRNARAFEDLGHALCISADSFIRTTEARHRRGVHELWRRLRHDDIIRKRYKGLYCVGCEDFLLPKDLVAGRCLDHDKCPEEVEEENYFFRLSAYQREIEELLSTDRIRVIPSTRRNEVQSFVRSGLQDISISRAAVRSDGWGIPVPGDPSQVVYVWIDALVNYISGLGFGSGEAWRSFWTEDSTKIHVIGKNVWKFHAVYWPALLLSAGVPLPDTIQVHGFLTEGGRKISKSLGGSVDPFACVERFGADGVRYYLLRAVSPWEDGDFSLDRLQSLYNTDLANGLGNLVSRLSALCVRAGFAGDPCCGVPSAPTRYHEAVTSFDFSRALASLWSQVTFLNQEIETTRPWEKLKSGDRDAVCRCLSKWTGDLHAIAYWLAPFLPDSSGRILALLSEAKFAAAIPLFPRVG